MKIYVTGLLAYETAGMLLEKHRAVIEARFPAFYIRELEQLEESGAAAESFFEKCSERTADNRTFSDKFCIEKHTKKPYSSMKYFFDGSRYIREITEGGIYAALWAACEDLGRIRSGQGAPCVVGCRIELEKIPVDQHIVEILDYLNESPYEVSSKGCRLIIGDPDNEKKRETDRGCVPWNRETDLTEIGQITDKKERVIVCGDNIRYLSPPKRQEQDITNRRQARPHSVSTGIKINEKETTQ